MERELLLALVLAHLRTLKPRQKVAFLREAAAILDAWTTAPPALRDNGVRAAREEAASWFRDHLGVLLA